MTRSPGGASRTPSRVWAWIKSHWLDLAIPPLFFLIAAGITAHFLWKQQGARFDEYRTRFRSAAQAGQKGDRETALREINAIAASAPNDAQVQAELAASYRSLHQPDKALIHQENALRLNPPQEAGYISLLAALCDRGKFEDADRLLTRDILPRWKDSAEAAYYQGVIHFFQDKGQDGLKRAIAALERCLARNPKHANALYQYGVCLTRANRPSEAESAFRKVLTVNPVHRGTHHELARALREQGKHQEAKTTLEQFENLDIAQRRVAYLNTQAAIDKGTTRDLLDLGRLHLTLNAPEKAEQALAQYLRKEPTDTRALRLLAQAYKRMNRTVDAAAMGKLAAALESRKVSTK